MAEMDFDNENDLDIGEPPKPASGFSFRRIFTTLAVVAGVVALGATVYNYVIKDDSISAIKAKAPATAEAPEKKEKSGGFFSSSDKKKKVKYTVLYTQLSPDITTSALRELSFSDIPFETKQNGKNFDLLIDEDRIDEAKNLLALKGIPGGEIKGYQLLDDSQTLGVTEFDKRVRFVRALSGELEKAITKLDMVEDAKVQIVLPEQRLFAVTQPPVTASVLIRKTQDGVLTDDVVFSIIQMVANSVENLQQENITVVDTEGHVLSEGIFERMAARRAGRIVPKRPTAAVEEAVSPTENVAPSANTGPTFASISDLNKWYALKEQYEKDLAKRAMRQLVGILPMGSYKVVIAADISPVIKDGQIEVRRLTTSIVVDSSRNDIYLDILTKKQIFNTIAGAIGYVKGRDTIQLNKADFSLLSAAERQQIMDVFIDKNWKYYLKLYGKYWPFVAVPVGVFVVYSLLASLVRRIRERFKRNAEELEDDDDNEDPEEGEPDFAELHQEVNPARYTEQIKTTAESNPQVIAQLMEEWLENDQEEEVPA
ncbi:MAG: hypothetical protein AB7F28_01630 [Candidatus Margulisiibacteriota bacterium]